MSRLGLKVPSAARSIIAGLLCASLCCGTSAYFVLAVLTGSPTPLAPGPTLLHATGLKLPPLAKIDRFHEEGFMDSLLEVRFEASKADSKAFMSQKPLAKAAWRANEDPFSFGWNGEKPKPPYRSATVELPNVSFLRVAVEERPTGPWRVWVLWFTT